MKFKPLIIPGEAISIAPMLRIAQPIAMMGADEIASPATTHNQNFKIGSQGRRQGPYK